MAGGAIPLPPGPPGPRALRDYRACGEMQAARGGPALCGLAARARPPCMMKERSSSRASPPCAMPWPHAAPELPARRRARPSGRIRRWDCSQRP